ncbi:hypothetical protein [Halobacteriovorax sp.]|uniref:hypothetical protein n=1 Tax=Halobacteriovorax sp. TaxID=2020862 RepID=UPI00356223A3
MKFLITIFFLFSILSSYGQENFGIKGKVDRLVGRQITSIYSNEVIARIENYNKLRNTPKKYFESIGMNPQEINGLIGALPELKTRSLPELLIRKSGILILRDRGSVIKFTFKSLGKREIYINGIKVKTPKMVDEKFNSYFKSFNENMYSAFNKKTTFIQILHLLNPIVSVQAGAGEDYLNIKDGTEVPHYNREGYDRSDKEIHNLYDNTDFNHNVRQTKQVLLAAIMTISSDLELSFMANYRNKKQELPDNLKKLYDKIDKLANSCNSFKEDPSKIGDVASYNQASRMLTSLDLVNEKMNRIESVGKNWWGEIDDLVWQRTSFHFNPDAKSYNICKVDRIREIYEDKNLCDNMDKITNCLIEFRSSGRVSDKRLTDDQMDLLIDNPRGRDYGQEDIMKWIQEK